MARLGVVQQVLNYDLPSLRRPTAIYTNAEVPEKWHNIGLSICQSLKLNEWIKVER